MPEAPLLYDKRPVKVDMNWPDRDTVALTVTSPAGTVEVRVTRVSYGEEAEAAVHNYEDPTLYFSLLSEAEAYLTWHPGKLEQLESFVRIRWQLHEGDACVPDLADVVDYARRVLLNER